MNAEGTPGLSEGDGQTGEVAVIGGIGSVAGRSAATAEGDACEDGLTLGIGVRVQVGLTNCARAGAWNRTAGSTSAERQQKKGLDTSATQQTHLL